MTRPRILLDITTLLRATGHADGITRTLWHLASYALDHRPDIGFVFLAPQPMLVDRNCVRHHLSGIHLIDISYFADPGARRRFRDRHPRLKPLLLWVQRPRHQALLLTERTILRDARFAKFARRIKPRMIYGKYRKMLSRSDGTLGHIIPRDMALRPLPSLGRDDTLIFAGSEWAGMRQTLELTRSPPKVAALCYDAIPLLYPEFFPAKFVSAFRRCVLEVYGTADLVIFSAQQIVRDTERLCGHALRDTAVIKLGADASLAQSGPAAALPPPLAAGRFALFVSTLEPRKGHRTLFEIWKTLVDEDIPFQYGFKLVFVGRKGWMVDDLVDEIHAHPSFGNSLLWFDNADDSLLAALYENCAFTLYPSLYEGFGLPVIESFQRGKAVIASGAGALRETVDGFSPCLDPNDRGAWLATLRDWITSPDAYRGYEQRIRKEFRPQSWAETAQTFFSLVTTRLDAGSRTQPHE